MDHLCNKFVSLIIWCFFNFQIIVMMILTCPVLIWNVDICLDTYWTKIYKKSFESDEDWKLINFLLFFDIDSWIWRLFVRNLSGVEKVKDNFEEYLLIEYLNNKFVYLALRICYILLDFIYNHMYCLLIDFYFTDICEDLKKIWWFL